MEHLTVRYACLACAIVALNFLLPRLLPGDPLDTAAPDGFSLAAPTLSAEARARFRASCHLDEPLPAQFVAYLADLGRGDLGWSISRATPVSQLIGDRLPWTLGLVFTSLLVASLSGGSLGLLAAWRGGRADRPCSLHRRCFPRCPSFSSPWCSCWFWRWHCAGFPSRVAARYSRPRTAAGYRPCSTS